MFIVAEVKEVTDHPRKENKIQKLYVVVVETGTGTVQVVSGGTNLKVGQRVIYAPPGEFMPGRNCRIREGSVDMDGVFTTGLILGIEDLISGSDGKGKAVDAGTIPVGYRVIL